MKRTPLIVSLVVGLVVIAGVTWWLTRRREPAAELVLYGNVDLRQVELAFNGAEPVAAVLVTEGDKVVRGQVLARLDTGRLAPQVAQAAAQVAAQQQVVDKLHRGARPEEIAQARANVAQTIADADNARDKYGRLTALAQSSSGRALSRQDLDDARSAAASAAARLAVNQQALRLQLAGPRREDVAQAEAELQGDRAQLALLQRELADASNTRDKYGRLMVLAQSSSGRALSRQDLDDAKSAAASAAARLAVNQQALRLQLAGPRREDIAQAEAELQGDRAQLALLQRELADAVLVAPTDATVRSRLIEPGEMASPQKPAFSLAITDPKWVRAYVTETDLGHVHPGMKAVVSADTFSKRGFAGWVGFISPVAEFTPKTVQTTDLRTSLVYEIRVFVKDPGDDLRLGMPATVHLPFPVDRARENR